MITEYQLQKSWILYSPQWENLYTVGGESVKVIQPGDWNLGQGPDFFHAHLMINGIHWYGHVEMHLKTSLWFIHAHETDPNFNNVILHVVLDHDTDRFDQSAVLELSFLKHIDLFSGDAMPNLGQLRCFGQPKLNLDQYEIFLDEWLKFRFDRKVNQIFELNHFHKGNLEQVLWILIARSFGQKVNADTFEEIASSISIDILKQNSSNHEIITLLLLGQAGLLEKNKESFQVEWSRKFSMLQFQHRLKPIYGKLFSLRMRPANFPMTRLLQLGYMISYHHDLLTLFSSPSNFVDFKKKIKIQTGSALLKTLYINVLIPFQIFLNRRLGNKFYTQDLYENLTGIHLEDSIIMRLFKESGIKPRHAKDSQSLLELYNQKCKRSDCSNCRFIKQ